MDYLLMPYFVRQFLLCNPSEQKFVPTALLTLEIYTAITFDETSRLLPFQ